MAAVSEKRKAIGRKRGKGPEKRPPSCKDTSILIKQDFKNGVLAK